MSINSLESLLNQMKGRSITHGWGAVVALGCAQLNRLLEEQYLGWLTAGRFIPPIKGEVFSTGGTESMRLDGLLLGRPVLSFGSASLDHSIVTLSMNIVAGTYTAISLPRNGAARLSTSFSITEGMGYKVEMKIGLNQLEGEVDKRGRVTLDLASDPEMTCNLGEGVGMQGPIAALIQSHLAALPDDNRIFELGLFDFSGYNPLSPTGFYIRTQKAPEGSTDPNDGAVLMFVRLKIKDENGEGLPTEGSGFPYLIPKDQSAGKDLYTASLVLNHEWIELLDEVQLDVLTSLLLPGGNYFERIEGSYEPHDLLVLGNIKPGDDRVTIEPPFISLKAGDSQTFRARKSDGTAVNAQWSVNNPISPFSVGTVTPTGGDYTAPVQSRMGNQQQPVVVTAQYAQGGTLQTSSALVLGAFESMSISSRVCTSSIGANAAPIYLKATALGGGGQLEWAALAPSEGTLQVIDNNHAIYKPPVDLTDPLAIQKVRVTDSVSKEAIEASIVLIKTPHSVLTDPPYVASITASTPIQFYADVPEKYAKWDVIGEGWVDGNGLFTPPNAPSSNVSVVRCAFVIDGEEEAAGFSIIQLTEQDPPPPTWEELQEFSIYVPDLSPNGCFSNGYQQIYVVIKIETKPVKVDGEDVYIPVSDAELATLRLVEQRSNSPVPFVPVTQEGIEYDSGIAWAANKKRNRFRLYSPTAAASSPSSVLPTPNNNGVRYRELWIHFAVEGSRTFYAQFDSPRGTYNSTDDKTEGYEVTVQGISPPTPAPGHYDFNRDRVWGDPNGYVGEPTPTYPEGDYFSYYRQSEDYWRLSYSRSGVYPVLFSTLFIEDNVSMIQWESELLDETFFSYTGYAFNPANYQNSDSPKPDGLSFDPYFWGLMRGYQKSLSSEFVHGKEPSPGELIVALRRTDDMKYWYDGMANGDQRKFYRKQMDPAIRFVVRDEEGNRHALSVSFDPPTLTDSRNKLNLKLI